MPVTGLVILRHGYPDLYVFFGMFYALKLGAKCHSASQKELSLIEPSFSGSIGCLEYFSKVLPYFT